MRQGCVVSPQLFTVYMDEAVRKMRAMVVRKGVKLALDRKTWLFVTCLFTDNSVLQAVCAEKL